MNHGLSSPVTVPAQPHWTLDYSGITTDQLIGLPDEQLAEFDPLAVNLIVAREIPSLSKLNISRYQLQVNSWAQDFRSRCLPYWETFFHQAPQDFRNDIRYFRLGMVAQYLDQQIGISYNEQQLRRTSIRYTNPSDLFLNGVLDTLQGTCGNMATLHVAFGWRMGWPVSLACMHSHYLVRYDDGEVTHNLEPTATGRGGFGSNLDCEYIEQKHISQRALACGSDLRALTPRERLGIFIGLRGRHYRDLGNEHSNRAYLRLAEQDFLLARYLFPAQRVLHLHGATLNQLLSDERFEPDEAGHSDTFGALMRGLFELRNGSWPCAGTPISNQAACDGSFESLIVDTLEV